MLHATPSSLTRGMESCDIDSSPGVRRSIRDMDLHPDARVRQQHLVDGDDTMVQRAKRHLNEGFEEQGRKLQRAASVAGQQLPPSVQRAAAAAGAMAPSAREVQITARDLRTAAREVVRVKTQSMQEAADSHLAAGRAMYETVAQATTDTVAEASRTIDAVDDAVEESLQAFDEAVSAGVGAIDATVGAIQEKALSAVQGVHAHAASMEQVPPLTPSPDSLQPQLNLISASKADTTLN